MLEVLRYIEYIALNACVKYCTKDQSNVKGVEGTLYRCNGMYVKDVEDGVEQKCVCMFFSHLQHLQHT